MGTDIHGWVEVKMGDHWYGMIRLDPLMRRNYEVFDLLFGGRSENYDTAIAGMRREPPDLSREGRKWGYVETWIGWDELQKIDWSQHEDILTDDWQRLFKIMQLIGEDPRILEMRLIVRFS